MGVDQIKGTELALRPDRLRDEFISKLLDICGDVRFLWLAELGQTTTSTDKSRHAQVITWSKDQQTWDAPTAKLGSGYAQSFDGVDEEGDTPDVDRHSFGDGVSDQPFSILTLINPTDLATSSSIVSAENSASAQEYALQIQITTGKTELFLRDEDASGTINSVSTNGLTAGTWTLVIATYDGARLNSGLKISHDAVAEVMVPSASGSYVAMKNTAALLRLAHRFITQEEFFAGDMAFALVTGKELIIEEQWVIKDLVNQFHDLSL